MLLTVKKQVEETVELKTPTYYKGASGVHYINESGQLIYASGTLILLWEPSHGDAYTNEVRSMLQYSQPCTKDEFEKAYAEVLAKFESAMSVVL